MLDQIVFQNPWWRGGIVERHKLGRIKRIVLEDLVASLESRNVTCLYGPRRVGKTTLMYDLINRLLNEGVARERILYTSLDNSKIRLFLEEDFDEWIKSYFIDIVGVPIDGNKLPVYVFLDEVHKLDDWGNKVKYWQDLGVKIKFIISGSTANKLLKGAGESLQGRIDLNLVLPLLFSEITGISLKVDPMDITEISTTLKDIQLKKQELLITLKDYLHRGGFPEFNGFKEMEDVYAGLRTYRTLAIYRDIVEEKDIREPRVLLDLFDLLTDFMSERINYSRFAEVLGVKQDTIKTYMSYLEEAFLVYPAYQYSVKRVISTRKEKKLFFFDHGLRNALLLREITPLEESKILENAVFVHLFHRMRTDPLPKMFFWLDTAKNEVDFISNIDRNTVPIEVKYQNQILSRDLRTIRVAMKKFGWEQGIVVTKDTLEERDGLILIPAWMFLLMN